MSDLETRRSRLCSYGSVISLRSAEFGSFLTLAGGEHRGMSVDVKAGKSAIKGSLAHKWKIMPADGALYKLSKPINNGDLIKLETVDTELNTRSLAITEFNNPTPQHKLIGDTSHLGHEWPMDNSWGYGHYEIFTWPYRGGRTHEMAAI